MNKQEVFDIVSTLNPDEQDLYKYQSEEEMKAFREGFEWAKSNAMLAVQQIKEPQKPVVPQYVADWYENHKSHFENNLVLLIKKWFMGEVEEDRLFAWIGYDLCLNNPIQTLVAMHKYGYKVEKEKLYTAQLKSTGEYLHYDIETAKIHHFFAYGNTAKNSKTYHFNKSILIKYNAWNNNAYDVNEVEE